MDGWADIEAAGQYTHRSQRVVRYWLKLGLRHVRLATGGVLIRYEWLDEYLLAREVRKTRADAIVDEVMASIKKEVRATKTKQSNGQRHKARVNADANNI